jgi:hypothetical protein
MSGWAAPWCSWSSFEVLPFSSPRRGHFAMDAMLLVRRLADLGRQPVAMALEVVGVALGEHAGGPAQHGAGRGQGDLADIVPVTAFDPSFQDRPSRGWSIGTGRRNSTVKLLVTVRRLCSRATVPSISSSTEAVQPPCATPGPPSWPASQTRRKRAIPSASRPRPLMPRRQRPRGMQLAHSLTPSPIGVRSTCSRGVIIGLRSDRRRRRSRRSAAAGLPASGSTGPRPAPPGRLRDGRPPRA